jgi:hypothetical protein
MYKIRESRSPLWERERTEQALLRRRFRDRFPDRGERCGIVELQTLALALDAQIAPQRIEIGRHRL